MESLRIKACVDLRLPVFTGSEAGVKKQWVNCRNRRRRNCSGIVACGSERNRNRRGENGSMSVFCRSHNYAILKHQMEVAAKSEVSVLFILSSENVSYVVVQFWKEGCGSYFVWNVVCRCGRITKRLRGFVTR